MSEEKLNESEDPRYCPEFATKARRKELALVLHWLGNLGRKSRSLSLAITKVEEAIMWLDADIREQERVDSVNTSPKPVDE